MTKESTPPPPDSTTSTTHQPPSQPNSPLAKRPKTEAMASVTESATSAANSNAQSTLPSLFVKKLIPEARAPTRGSAFAAGYDVYSAKGTVIPAKGKGLVDTGLAIAVPEGTCTRIVFIFYIAALYAILPYCKPISQLNTKYLSSYSCRWSNCASERIGIKELY